MRCSFPAPTPPETRREHGFFNAFEGIRGVPPGRARLRKWRPSHALEASGVALTWPWRGPGVALTCYVGRWCGARFRPQPLQNPSGSMFFSMPSKGSACTLRGRHARGQGWAPKVATLSAKTTVLEHARGFRGFRGFPGNGGSNCGANPPLTHAPGARMTVVTQTPSNYVIPNSLLS